MSRSYSPEGFNLTKQFEGLSLKAYHDVRGVLTNGYGHTGSDVFEGQVVTQEQADHWLAVDVAGAVLTVDLLVRVPINQNQFDALVDLVYNIGSSAFRGSTLLKLLNADHYLHASYEFVKWDHAAGKEIPGLLKRREAEQALFVK